MANIAHFELRAIGTKENLQPLINTMKRTNSEHPRSGPLFKRVYDTMQTQKGVFEVDDGLFAVEYVGSCKWSALALTEHAWTHVDTQDPTNASLNRLSERCNLQIEVYGSEDSVGFEEHYIIQNGVMLQEEERDALWLYTDDYEDYDEMKEYADMDGYTFTRDQYDQAQTSEVIVLGGFQSHDFKNNFI